MKSFLSFRTSGSEVKPAGRPAGIFRVQKRFFLRRNDKDLKMSFLKPLFLL